jgi:hypothetical protein
MISTNICVQLHEEPSDFRNSQIPHPYEILLLAIHEHARWTKFGLRRSRMSQHLAHSVESVERYVRLNFHGLPSGGK